MAWTKFTMQGARGMAEKRASLNVRGVFTLNQLTYDEMGNPPAVELFYDKDERLIGLKPSTLEVPHAYKVRQQGKNKSYLISARAYCGFFGIEIPQTIKFVGISMIADVLALDLKTAVAMPSRTLTTDGTATETARLFDVDES